MDEKYRKSLFQLLEQRSCREESLRTLRQVAGRSVQRRELCCVNIGGRQMSRLEVQFSFVVARRKALELADTGEDFLQRCPPSGSDSELLVWCSMSGPGFVLNELELMGLDESSLYADIWEVWEDQVTAVLTLPRTLVEELFPGGVEFFSRHFFSCWSCEGMLYAAMASEVESIAPLYVLREQGAGEGEHWYSIEPKVTMPLRDWLWGHIEEGRFFVSARECTS
jgi:hypothetical protein